SCLVLYWAYQDMNDGDSRQMAFTYGLGSISGTGGSGTAGDGKIALTAGGSMRPGKEFTVTASVNGPKNHQEVKVTLAEGVTFAKGQVAEKHVESIKDGRGLVSWLVRSDKEGLFKLEAESGSARATLEVRIRAEGLY